MGFNPLIQSLQLTRTQELIEKYQPDFFLFSGSGNDVAGPDGLRFESYLNHAKSKLSLGHLKKDYVNYMINEVFYEMFVYLIEAVKSKKKDIQIFLHGYGYPIPDGRAVIQLGDYKFVGPWFDPALRRKGFSEAEGKIILHSLIDALNNMLSKLAQEYSDNVHYIDLRPIIQDEDWENELHLTAQGFKKVADEFEQQILKVLQS